MVIVSVVPPGAIKSGSISAMIMLVSPESLPSGEVVGAAHSKIRSFAGWVEEAVMDAVTADKEVEGDVILAVAGVAEEEDDEPESDGKGAACESDIVAARRSSRRGEDGDMIRRYGSHARFFCQRVARGYGMVATGDHKCQ